MDLGRRGLSEMNEEMESKIRVYSMKKPSIFNRKIPINQMKYKNR